VRRTRRAASPLLATALLAAIALAGAACGSRDDDRVGGSFIVDQGQLKAVRLLEIAAADTSTDFQVEKPAAAPGLSNTLPLGHRSGLESRMLIRFETGAFPDSGTPIDSAAVRFLAFDGIAAADSISFGVHRITSNWIEADDFDSTGVPSFLAEAVDTQTIAVPAAGDTVRIQVPSLFRFWCDTPDSNFGMLLDPVDGTDGMIELASGETTTPPIIQGFWNDGVADTSVALATTHDSFRVEAAPDFVNLAGVADHLTLARGFPARALVKFGIPGPDSLPELWDRGTVNRAELVLHLDAGLSSFLTLRIGAQRVLEEPWAVDSTTVDGLLFGLADAEPESSTVTLEVGNLITELLQEGDADHGFLLRTLDERVDADVLRFWSETAADPTLRPSLTIWYTPGDLGGGGS
jgi:hypothetical protein